MSNDTTKPFIHLINDKSPELHEMHERLKLVAAAYLMAYEDDVQDIGTPNALAQYFLDQVVEQSL